jgi:hypothetical protein
MKWLSEEGEPSTRFEVFVVYPVALFVFLSMVAFLLLMPE